MIQFAKGALTILFLFSPIGVGWVSKNDMSLNLLAMCRKLSDWLSKVNDFGRRSLTYCLLVEMTLDCKILFRS